MAKGNTNTERAAVVRRFVEEYQDTGDERVALDLLAPDFDVIDIVRVRDGLMVEHWNVVDALALMAQVGAVPAPS